MSHVQLTADEARRLQLRAQGLLGAAGQGHRDGGVPALLEHLGAVQLDTISVLARSHELVPYARLGAVGRAAVEDAYWGDGATFEYWAHAASILPISEWPSFAFRRRAFRARGVRWHKVPDGACEDILERLRADGPLTTKELGGAKSGADWWQWSDAKIAIEWLLDIGEVVCVQRVGWRRVYDLAERAVPADLLAQDPDDSTCLTRLVSHAGRALGVATRADLADYFRVRGDQVSSVIEATDLVPVEVQGWKHPAWADPEALAKPPRGRHTTTLLSPFDSLVWDRARTSRVFGFDHRLEAYVPKAKRVHGYFAMPLLAGGRLLGRVDPAREGKTLVARQVSLEPWATATPARTETTLQALRTALWQAATWVACDDVRVEKLNPSHLLPTLDLSPTT
ncbi:winged helix-turn-helix domain-containing protein [Actinomadura rudentiformis]|uniref:winged helix-turn-helix domain-containing protein n=1 Tax=Actinomadura rudentiformis TaxID=359158 RepID=UPI001CEF8637|nr:crosslink repair DNA glycosylase YcaQ family protein [Actinomadura rudentiformis]